jgi:hypothetical protein
MSDPEETSGGVCVQCQQRQFIDDITSVLGMSVSILRMTMDQLKMAILEIRDLKRECGTKPPTETLAIK